MHVQRAKTKTGAPQAPPSSEARRGAPNPATASTKSTPTFPQHNYHCNHLHKHGRGLTTTPPQQTHQHLHHLATTKTPTPDSKPLFRKKRPPTGCTGNKTTTSRSQAMDDELSPMVSIMFQCLRNAIPPTSFARKEVPFS